MSSSYLPIETIHVLIWIALIFLLSHSNNLRRFEIVDGQEAIRYQPLWAVLIFAPVVIMTVYGRLRSDMWGYIASFRALPDHWEQGWTLITQSKSPGFALLGVAIKSIFGNNETVYRLLIALIHAIPVIVIIRKYSENYLFSIYLFLATGTHIGWMMNGMRQFMAVTIIFAATPWIIQKKYFRVILVILLATSIHSTALFMIPVIFIVQGKVWNWKTIVFSLTAIVLAYIFGQNTRLFDNFASSIGYSLDAAREFGDDGAHPLRVLVSGVPMAIAFLYRHKLREENNSIINISTNMSVITTGIYLISVVTSGIMVGRMPIYTSLYSFILLPYLINECFTGRTKTLVQIGAVIMYYVYGLVA